MLEEEAGVETPWEKITVIVKGETGRKLLPPTKPKMGLASKETVTHTRTEKHLFCPLRGKLSPGRRERPQVADLESED